jgi:hypothetical protein
MSFRDTGLIVYDPNRGTMKTRITNWCVLQVDKEITRYYRWWVRNHLWTKLEVPSYDAHCSCVRGEFIQSDKLSLWKKYHGKTISFEYDNEIRSKTKSHESGATTHYFINVYSKQIDALRDELGLKVYTHYHITIGKLYY